MLSVNTNYGAMIALQNLNKTTSELEDAQNRINTGLKIAGPKDNGAVWADTGLDLSDEIVKRFDAAAKTAPKK